MDRTVEIQNDSFKSFMVRILFVRKKNALASTAELGSAVIEPV